MSEKFVPWPYQDRTISLIDTGESVAVWAEMGLGKTVAVLTALESRIYDQCIPTKALVLAPKLVADTVWPVEAVKWEHLQDLRVVNLVDNRETVLNDCTQWDVAVISRNLLPWIFDQYVEWHESPKGKRTWKWRKDRPWPFNVVVIDEASAFKSPSGVWFTDMARIARTGCQIIELTGTPSPNGVDDLWAQTFLLDRGKRLEDGITKFRERWLMPEALRRVGNGYQVDRWIPKPGAFNIIMNKLSDISVSLKAEDWLDMPEKIIRERRVDIPTRAMEQYRRLERTAVLALGDDRITAGSAGAVIGKLLQMANGRVYDETRTVHDIHTAKLEALKEIIEDATSPVLVFYSYEHDLEAIRKAVPGIRTLDDNSTVEEWNAGKIKVLVAHPASAGHGLNLQGGGNTIVWYGLPYNLEWYQQANARLYRQGQKAPSVIIHHIVANDTIDEAVLEALANKEATQNRVLDAVRYRLGVAA